MIDSYTKPHRIGYLSLPVLQFLWGQPYDQLAANIVHSLRPSCVRFSEGEVKSDSHQFRVTVYFKEDKVVSIEQEVEVGLDGGFAHGHAVFTEATKRGIQLRP